VSRDCEGRDEQCLKLHMHDAPAVGEKGDGPQEQRLCANDMRGAGACHIVSSACARLHRTCYNFCAYSDKKAQTCR
jgi:hypothetical protein